MWQLIISDEVSDRELIDNGPRRIVVAPIVILLGLVTEIFAIMWRPKVKEDQNEEKAE